MAHSSTACTTSTTRSCNVHLASSSWRGLRGAVGTSAAATAAAASVVARPRRAVRPALVPRASESDDGPEEITRDTIKRLTKLFYYDREEPLVTRTSQADDEEPGSSQAATAAAAAPPAAASTLRFTNLPLWRTEWAVLPGCQEFLHVLAPHYVHMFEAIFSRPRPWLFGHLLLPAGSKNLGAPAYRLASGTQAPLVGVLVQVTRAVRLRDGKFLILATACARFKVVRCVRELPYSVADVELLEDAELLEALQGAASNAVMQAAGDDVALSSLMAATTAATREAAAAVSWAWLRGYELSVAGQQEWPGPGPREGDSDLETHLLVQELLAHGVSEVLPLPDGVVIGRCDLHQVAAAADTALQDTLQSVGQLLQVGQAAMDGSAPGVLAGSSSSITSLNTVAERGVNLQGAEFSDLLSSTAASNSLEDLLLLEAAVWAQLDTLIALASRVKGTRHVLPFGLLQLRPAPVQPSSMLQYKAPTAQAHDTADAVVVDAARGSSAEDSSSSSSSSSEAAHSTSWDDGLQPPPAAEVVSDEPDDTPISFIDPSSSAEASVLDSSSSSSSSSSSVARSQEVPSSSSTLTDPQQQQQQQQQGSGTSEYAYAASDGCDAHADPLWPPLRRVARLSWAAASVVGQLEQDKAEVRQALLEATSVAQRLQFVLAVLGKHIKVLAAVAAVKSVQNER